MKYNLYVVDLIVRQVVLATGVADASILAAQTSQASIEANGFIHSQPILITHINSLPPDVDGNTVPVNSQQTIAAILGVK